MLYGNKSKSSMPQIRKSTAIVSRQNSAEQAPLLASVLKNSMYALLAMLLSGLVLISISTAIAYANPNPDSLVFPLSLASLLISMFIGGFVCSKRTCESPLLCGIVCGGIITLFTILIALCLRNAASSGYTLGFAFLLHGIAMLFAILGAFAGNIKKKYKPRKRKYR